MLFRSVALDQACVDAVNNAPIINQSYLAEVKHVHNDHFYDMHPNTEWKTGIAHAETLGLGSHEYELLEV